MWFGSKYVNRNHVLVGCVQYATLFQLIEITLLLKFWSIMTLFVCGRSLIPRRPLVAIIRFFDADGTEVDIWLLHHHCWMYMLDRAGLLN